MQAWIKEVLFAPMDFFPSRVGMARRGPEWDFYKHMVQAEFLVA